MAQEEKTIKPSLTVSVQNAVYSIMDQMQRMGLNERDLILLIQDRAKGNISKSDIKSILEAISLIEKQFIKVRDI